MANAKVTQLPNLPRSRWSTSVVLSDNEVYVVGGGNNIRGYVRSVYYLSLGRDAWQTKKAMPHAVQNPLVIQHQQCIYVLGGYNSCIQSSSVSQYNIKDNTWKQCNDMPVACDIRDAGVVVHEGRIKVITVDKCLEYDDDTDDWSVRPYSKLCGSVLAFVRSGQICAAAWNDGDTYSMMSYDDVDNVWKTESEEIDNALGTGFFC